MQVQIGATFNYFTSYKANAYNPLLSEFTLQNTEEIGFPSVDLFLMHKLEELEYFLE